MQLTNTLLTKKAFKMPFHETRLVSGYPAADGHLGGGEAGQELVNDTRLFRSKYLETMPQAQTVMFETTASKYV